MAIRKSVSSRIFDIFNYILLTGVMILCLIPFLFIISASVSPVEQVLEKSFFIIPRSIDLRTYQYLLSTNKLMNSLGVSFLITIVGTLLCMTATVLTAYPLSKKRFRGRNFFQFLIVFTMLFSGGMIPTYLVVSGLNLTNTLWALWLPSLIAAFNMILLRNFFQQLPEELEEAGIIDGANDLTILVKITVPLSMPAIATFSLFYAVDFWNSYFSSILYINDDSKWPIQVWLRQIVILSAGGFSDTATLSEIGYIPPMNVSYGVIVLATLPILVIYPFLQKYFTKGLMVGSVKG